MPEERRIVTDDDNTIRAESMQDYRSAMDQDPYSRYETAELYF